jgi:hypothetical protein
MNPATSKKEILLSQKASVSAYEEHRIAKDGHASDWQ